MRGRRILILLTTALFTGVIAQSPVVADAGTTQYTDWTWSADGSSADPWVAATVQGTSFHYEGGGYSGITARLTGNEPNIDSTTHLQRNLSWVDDGWVTVATVQQREGWKYDSKRYRMSCGQWIQYRLNDGNLLVTSKVYVGRGLSGERC